MKEGPMLKLLNLAIQREEEAYRFYRDILDGVNDKSTREAIEFIAAEEQKHRAFLVKFRDGGESIDTLRLSDAVYYKIAEYLQEPGVGADMSSSDVYLVASHRELRSHQFYTELAESQDDMEFKGVLLKIASEELKHKEKMEYLYANSAFPQTDGG